MENGNQNFERVDLGIEGLGLGDFVIGAVLWAGRLLTRQYGHEPSIGQHTASETPTEPTTRMAEIGYPYDESGREVE